MITNEFNVTLNNTGMHNSEQPERLEIPHCCIGRVLLQDFYSYLYGHSYYRNIIS